MNKSEEIGELLKAVLEVMNAVKGIEKNLVVGTGKNTYKGVADKDVKIAIGEQMAESGLVILPLSVTPKISIAEWMGKNSYNEETRKQSVFTEVITSYLLAHAESGQWVEIAGYGQGEDSQDKGAGKATTYALKNTLLYSFLVATGTIDDTDKEHSDDKEQKPKTGKNPVPPVAKPQPPTGGVNNGKMTLYKFLEDGKTITTAWNKAVNVLATGKNTLEGLEKVLIISDELKDMLLKEVEAEKAKK